MGKITQPGQPLALVLAQPIRNAMLLRDRHCQWAGGCTQPAGTCEVHHTKHKANGGTTAVKTSDAVKLSSCLGDFLGGGGEGGGLVVVLAGEQAVVEAAEEAAGEVALGGGVPVAGVFAAVVVGAGAG